MISGYWSALFLLVTSILLATGWKPLIAPDVKPGALAALCLVWTGMFALPLWWSPPGAERLDIHAAAVLIAAIGVRELWRTEEEGSRIYLLFCAVMLGALWGSLRILYARDPMMHLFDPGLDAPIICGLLGGALASAVRQQFGLVAAGAFAGELWAGWKQEAVVSAHVGSAEWRDGVCVAIAFAALSAAAGKGLRSMARKRTGRLQERGGGTSP